MSKKKINLKLEKLRRKENLELLKSNHVYSENMEHDACGVGLVSSTDGKKSRQVVEYGIEALKAVWHRGAIDADWKTGDGAGIHIEIPSDFFIEKIEATGHKHDNSEVCVGMLFLPRNNYGAQEACRTIVESELTKSNFNIYGWRQVPVNPSVLGEKADSNRPEITQVIFKSNKSLDRNELERLLFVSRKKINWLIDAAHEISQEGYEIKLNILGFGKQENYLKKLAGITSAEVTFFDDLDGEGNSEFYKSIDIFAMPSTSKYFGIEFEGLGLVYLEAGTYGLPVIVGASGGSVETILPGRSGFVVSSPKLLKEAILYFINNPEKIEEFGRANKKFVEENYNWDKSINKLESNFI